MKMKRSQRGIALLLLVLLTLSAWGTAESFADIDLSEWEPLERGAKGEVVELLQERLIELGYLDGDADGAFGPKTEKAVIAFQSAAELEETGIIDVDTMEALFSEEAPTPAPTIKPTPKPKAKSNSGSGVMVWIPRTGKRYHRKETCSNMKNPSYVTIEEAKRLGFTPCKKCY